MGAGFVACLGEESWKGGLSVVLWPLKCGLLKENQMEAQVFCYILFSFSCHRYRKILRIPMNEEGEELRYKC